jgi:hypothetical protein
MDEEASHGAHVEDSQGSTARRQLAASRKRTKRPRKERRDKGKKLIKRRDLIVLLWIAQQYGARLDQVQALLSRMPGRGGKPVSPSGLTLSAVLQVVDRWVTLGLVHYRRIYDDEPGWVWLTSYALRLLHLPYTMRTPADSTLSHLYTINRVRLDLEGRHPEYQWLSERTLRAAQPRREEGTTLPHLPDAQVRTPKLVAVEVERSPKSDKELDNILTELLITGSPSTESDEPLLYTTVWYFVRPKTRTSVEQARDRLPPDCQPRVKVLSLETLTEFPPEEVRNDAAFGM